MAMRFLEERVTLTKIYHHSLVQIHLKTIDSTRDNDTNQLFLQPGFFSIEVGLTIAIFIVVAVVRFEKEVVQGLREEMGITGMDFEAVEQGLEQVVDFGVSVKELMVNRESIFFFVLSLCRYNHLTRTRVLGTGKGYWLMK